MNKQTDKRKNQERMIRLKQENNFQKIIILGIISLCIMMNSSIVINTLFFIMGLIFLFYYKINLKIFIGLLVFLLPVSSSIFFMNLFFFDPSLSSNSGTVILFGHSFYIQGLINGLELFVKIYTISVISISAGSMINFFYLIYTGMQQYSLPKKIGYPVFIAFNAIIQIRAEYQRIRTVRKMRKIANFNLISLLLPLMVFAVRFSERSSISLISKGFDNSIKNYYFDYSEDKIYIMNSLILGILIFFYFLFLFFFHYKSF